MKKTLYLECYSGISGDMTVAALLDLGANREVLDRMLQSLPLEGFRIRVSRVKKSGVDACDFDVILDEAHENHDHDMEYLHGHASMGSEKDHSHGHASMESEKEHSHGHASMESEKEHSHGHASMESEKEHSHEHAAPEIGKEHLHHHAHRGLREILEIIRQAEMSDRARSMAERIFQILAQAEAKAHQVPVEEVHFHEVGAVDSIVDILSAAVCADDLGITDVIVPVLYEGCGTIRCQHGILPVPVPAVANIVQECGLTLKRTDVAGELVTPTGAAIAAAFCTGRVLPQSFTIEKIGTGAGKRDYACPGILRAMLIRPAEEELQNRIVKLESNIDDCSGEALGYVMERLFEAGARDVHYVPAFMKKNRPAWILGVICGEEDVSRMEKIIFEETTTIGIRRTAMERSVLKRCSITVSTPLGDARVKVCETGGKQRFYPEYESTAELSRKNGSNFTEVYQMIINCSREQNE